MKILALDLGKSKSVACVYEAETSEHRFETIRTTATEIDDLMDREDPQRVVIEVCTAAGWVADLVRAREIELEVANPTHDAWRWKNVKRKTDRDDALKLAQLSAMRQLPTVHTPERRVRQWRSLIAYRQRLVRRRTAIKNHIRAVLDRQGLPWPAGKKGWTNLALVALRDWAQPFDEVAEGSYWRAELFEELRQYDAVERSLAEVEFKLNALGEADARVRLLRTIPGVGARLSEALVAVIDDPRRFRNGKQVGSYVGLTPRQYQSGAADRQGRISGAGNPRLRSLLVEVSWLGLRVNPWMNEIYERVRGGSPSRKKIAIVAVARRLLIRCWAMLRDGQSWQPPEKTTDRGCASDLAA
jgi:transposase